MRLMLLARVSVARATASSAMRCASQLKIKVFQKYPVWLAYYGVWLPDVRTFVRAPPLVSTVLRISFKMATLFSSLWACDMSALQKRRIAEIIDSADYMKRRIAEIIDGAGTAPHAAGLLLPPGTSSASRLRCPQGNARRRPSAAGCGPPARRVRPVLTGVLQQSGGTAWQSAWSGFPSTLSCCAWQPRSCSLTTSSITGNVRVTKEEERGSFL